MLMYQGTIYTVLLAIAIAERVSLGGQADTEL